MLLGAAALGDLAVGDAPFAPSPPPPFPRTAGDFVVCNATAQGFGSTDVTSITFQYANVNKIDPQRVWQYGATFVLEAGLPMENAPDAVLTVFFTRPDGSKLSVASPQVYIGQPNLSTYLGVLAGNTYAVTVIGPSVLVPGQWCAQLSFAPTPSSIPVLSEVGRFTIPPV